MEIAPSIETYLSLVHPSKRYVSNIMFHNNINKDETCFKSNNIHLSNKGTKILVANLKSHLRGQANGRRGPEAKRNQPRQLRQNNTDQTNMIKNFQQGFLKML